MHILFHIHLTKHRKTYISPNTNSTVNSTIEIKILFKQIVPALCLLCQPVLNNTNLVS